MNLQPTLENSKIILFPLKEENYEELYEVASNPEIWIQHPNPLRYQKSVFQNFFEHAILSKGALLIRQKVSNKVIGCSRYYDHNPSNKSILIGYTFFGKKYWGNTYNYSAKFLMLNYIFQFVDTVYFHIGQYNLRSQISIQRLGAKFARSLEISYAGEKPMQNFEYVIDKESWPDIKRNLFQFIE